MPSRRALSAVMFAAILCGSSAGHAACEAVLTGEIDVEVTAVEPPRLLSIEVDDRTGGIVKRLTPPRSEGEASAPDGQRTDRVAENGHVEILSGQKTVITPAQADLIWFRPDAYSTKIEINFSGLDKCPNEILLNVRGFRDEDHVIRSMSSFAISHWIQKEESKIIPVESGPG